MVKLLPNLELFKYLGTFITEDNSKKEEVWSITLEWKYCSVIK